MDFNFLNKKTEQGNGKKGKEKNNFLGNAAGAILIFMLISGAYLAISGDSKITPEIPISDLAKGVSGGEVMKLKNLKKKSAHRFLRHFLIMESRATRFLKPK